MTIAVQIQTNTSFQIHDFLRELDMNGCQYAGSADDEDSRLYYFYFEDSTTFFAIQVEDGAIALNQDGMASWEDYKRFPYILDVLSQYLTGDHYSYEGKSAYQRFDEDWIAEMMGQEIAFLKVTLSHAERYDIDMPLVEGSYVTTELLRQHGVSLHSSTSRIYGYVHYLMVNDSLPADKDNVLFPFPADEEFDVPQHIPIGRVKSWMLDGSETWESFSREDVDLLLDIASSYRKGERGTKGVVLNDIGTIYQMGIGVPADGTEAAYWFAQGYKQGDHWYSPTNLGDLHRKGCGELKPDLRKALEAYALSEDPYAWYRIGQAWEEGWIPEKKDLDHAKVWYRRAADAGRHLALKALKRLENKHTP